MKFEECNKIAVPQTSELEILSPQDGVVWALKAPHICPV